MRANSFKINRKWGYAGLVVVVALLFTIIELLESSSKGASISGLSISTFATNALYTILGLYLFQLVIDFLNKKFPWSNGTTKRFFLQLGLSLFLYLLFQSIIVYGIEPSFNENSSTSLRIMLTFMVGIGLVILINFGYLIYHFKQKERITPAEIHPLNFLQGRVNGKKIFIPKSDFLYFYIANGIIFGINNAQQKVILKESLADLEKILDTTQYFRANRKEIIGKSAITQVNFQSEKTAIILNIGKEILVSRRKIPTLRKWLQSTKNSVRMLNND